ncbi:MAG TPA: aliphatic sulfonate ABC transporter substrate-binding protein [Polyangiaceae bacterium]|nr:aliphatic sulfonate ABC transporter substrate-binding protein [Polyangiaceae bacterium]
MLTLPESTSSPLSVRAKAMVFEDPASRAVLARIERVAPTDAPVLITGETGTGKELVARHLHALSRRAEQPFLALNAGAFSESLIESELFGHERGAFTGASAARVGWFEAAQGGTLFLDEIGDLPLALQVKLLRVLQEGEVVRVGSHAPRKIDVRLIAATNVDLQAAARAKHFREDLYYRLKVASVALPPLRERPSDILPLARYFSKVYAQRLGREELVLTRAAGERLLAHAWPGNIRELENTIHHAALIAEGGLITPAELQLDGSIVASTLPPPSNGLAKLDEGSPVSDSPAARVSNESALDALDAALSRLLEEKTPQLHERVEARLFAAAYRHSGNNQLEAARLLGLSRHIVRARLLEHGALKGPEARASGRHRASDSPPSATTTISRLAAPRTLRLGYQRLGLFMWLKARGDLESAFASRGVQISWHEFPGGIQMVDALARGALDVGALGDCPAVFAQAQSIPITYVAAEPAAPRGAALIVPASSQVFAVSELKGRRIAVNRAAQAHYLLIKALEEQGVHPSEVEIVFATPERALQAFRTGEVDAWSIWDPWLSNARVDLGARTLRDSNGLMANSVYYVARRQLAQVDSDLIAVLLRQLEQTACWARQDPARAADLVAAELGFSVRAVQASLERDLGLGPLTSAQLAAQQEVADGLWRMQLIPRAVSVAEARWDLKLAG